MRPVKPCVKTSTVINDKWWFNTNWLHQSILDLVTTNDIDINFDLEKVAFRNAAGGGYYVVCMYLCTHTRRYLSTSETSWKVQLALGSWTFAFLRLHSQQMLCYFRILDVLRGCLLLFFFSIIDKLYAKASNTEKIHGADIFHINRLLNSD